jgi:hypothetical protein
MAKKRILTKREAEIRKIVRGTAESEPGGKIKSEFTAEIGHRSGPPEKYSYPHGWELKPVSEQAVLLKDYFPELDISYVEELTEHYFKTSPTAEQGDAAAGHYYRSIFTLDGEPIQPLRMDGLGVFPKLSRVKLPPSWQRPWLPLNLAMERLLNIIREVVPRFSDFSRGMIGPEDLRFSEATARAYTKLDEKIPGDVLVLPVQTGLNLRGKTVRQARSCFTPGEFGLDPFAVGCFILVHPERLPIECKHLLWIDCPGIEAPPDKPQWHWFYADGPTFGWWSNEISEGFVSATALLPTDL